MDKNPKEKMKNPSVFAPHRNTQLRCAAWSVSMAYMTSTTAYAFAVANSGDL